MKKTIILLAAIMLPLLAGAQAQINTKKVKVGDFTEKVTKVVLSGNAFHNQLIKDEVSAGWRISPYEFCTLEEFEAIKGDDQYYFLMFVSSQFKKETEPGIMFLTLVKGGEGAEKGISSMLEVVSVPVASAEDSSGREFVFMPALLDIIQEHTLASMENDVNAYGGLGQSAENINESAGMTIIFSEEDLAPSVTEEIIKAKFDEKILITDSECADQYMVDNAAGTLVSYVVAPTEPVNGSFCYKMLIDSETHKLYYYRKHRISKNNKAGFLPADITKITVKR